MYQYILWPGSCVEPNRHDRRGGSREAHAALAKAAAEAEAAFAEGRQAAPTLIPSGATWKPQQSHQTAELPEEPPEGDGDDADEELEPLEDIEHLQLTLQEAFFLIWNLGCLAVLDLHSVHVLSLRLIQFLSNTLSDGSANLPA